MYILIYIFNLSYKVLHFLYKCTYLVLTLSWHTMGSPSLRWFWVDGGWCYFHSMRYLPLLWDAWADLLIW